MNASSFPDKQIVERSTLRATWGAATDVGKKRTVNEDSFLAVPGMWVIADGMGGHSAGKTASETAVQVLAGRAGDLPLRLEDVPALLDEANRKVHDIGKQKGYDVVGTTLNGIVLVDNGGEDALLLFNIGDSRCYELVDGQDMVQRTVDHSYVQELIDRGSIGAEEARTHPDRNVVSRAVGLDESVAADYWVLSPQNSSRLLLCSDGLTTEVDDSQIANTLRAADSPEDCAESLMALIEASPARDNTTLIVLEIEWVRGRGVDGADSASVSTTVERPSRSEVSPTFGTPTAVADFIDSVPGRSYRSESKVESAEAIVDRIPENLSGIKGGDE